MKPGRKPASLPCGHCGASTALSWRSDGDGGAMGQGRCPSCGYLVHSFVFDDGLPLDIFLSALLSSFPDAACKLHFGPPAPPPKSPRGSLIA
jgi:hypothetical protein